MQADTMQAVLPLPLTTLLPLTGRLDSVRPRSAKGRSAWLRPNCTELAKSWSTSASAGRLRSHGLAARGPLDGGRASAVRRRRVRATKDHRRLEITKKVPSGHTTILRASRRRQRDDNDINRLRSRRIELGKPKKRQFSQASPTTPDTVPGGCHCGANHSGRTGLG